MWRLSFSENGPKWLKMLRIFRNVCKTNPFIRRKKIEICFFFLNRQIRILNWKKNSGRYNGFDLEKDKNSGRNANLLRTIIWLGVTVTGKFPPGKFPPEGSAPVVSPRKIPPQRSLALRNMPLTRTCWN